MCERVRAFGIGAGLRAALPSARRYDACCCEPAVGCGYQVRSAHSLLSAANSGATPSSLARFGSAPRARKLSARSYWPLMIATSIGVDRSPPVGALMSRPASSSAHRRVGEPVARGVVQRGESALLADLLDVRRRPRTAAAGVRRRRARPARPAARRGRCSPGRAPCPAAADPDRTSNRCCGPSSPTRSGRAPAAPALSAAGAGSDSR